MRHLLLSLILASAPSAVAAPVPIYAEVVATGLEDPWAVVPSPDGRLFLTEQRGTIRIFENGKLSGALTGLPSLAARGQGGLLDLAFHPKFPENGWIYLAYSTGKPMHTRVSRFKLTGSGLSEKKQIVDGATGGDSAHFGCRLLFGADGKLYVTLGERHAPKLAQDLGALNGKVLRLNDDGSIPADNPFSRDSRPGLRKEIFSYGHRNPQGLDMHPASKRLYITEHGPTGYDAPHGGDEVNLLSAGANFGWPEAHHDGNKPGMTAPLRQYTPAVAPSGAAFYTGSSIPEWKNDFFFAALRGEKLVRLRLKGGKIEEEEALLTNRFGRLRDVATGTDGYLYVISEDGRLIRLSKASAAP